MTDRMVRIVNILLCGIGIGIFMAVIVVVIIAMAVVFFLGIAPVFGQELAPVATDSFGVDVSFITTDSIVVAPDSVLFAVSTPEQEIGAFAFNERQSEFRLRFPVFKEHLLADFDSSGTGDFPDFVFFAKEFEKESSDPDFDSRFDLNKNGIVDFPDFITFARAFNKIAQFVERAEFQFSVSSPSFRDTSFTRELGVGVVDSAVVIVNTHDQFMQKLELVQVFPDTISLAPTYTLNGEVGHALGFVARLNPYRNEELIRTEPIANELVSQTAEPEGLLFGTDLTIFADEVGVYVVENSFRTLTTKFILNVVVFDREPPVVKGSIGGTEPQSATLTLSFTDPDSRQTEFNVRVVVAGLEVLNRPLRSLNNFRLESYLKSGVNLVETWVRDNVGNTTYTTWTVTLPAGILSVEPLSLDFGTVNIGDKTDKAVTVKNVGKETLDVMGVSSSDGQFAPSDGAFELTSGASRAVYISFRPTREGAISATLTIESDGGSASIALSGVGIVYTPPTNAAPTITAATVNGAASGTVIIAAGSALALSASYSGTPNPMATWTLGSRSASGPNATLPAQNGTLTLTVSNSEGSVSRTWTIVALGAP